MPGKFLQFFFFTTCMTPLLTRETAAWLVLNGGIATSCTHSKTCVLSELSSSVNQLRHEPHQFRKNVVITVFA